MEKKILSTRIREIGADQVSFFLYFLSVCLKKQRENALSQFTYFKNRSLRRLAKYSYIRYVWVMGPNVGVCKAPSRGRVGENGASRLVFILPSSGSSFHYELPFRFHLGRLSIKNTRWFDFSPTNEKERRRFCKTTKNPGKNPKKMANFPNPVWLNVGGEQFCCSLETLTWHRGTFFSGLFREGSSF